MSWWIIALILIGGLLTVLAIWDMSQKKRAVLRNFPIIGHLRFILERIGPELRQYIVSDNNEELPFSRDQRRWVYATAKQENPYFGFGTDNVVTAPGHVLIHHNTFPLPSPNNNQIPVAKVLGAWRKRPKAFRPSSIVNISALSFGSLSGHAVQALNQGALLSKCLHNTGEGGIADHHRHGGDLIFQIGTGYFGCRTNDGNLALDKLVDTVNSATVKAIELKLSQGAKPGIGGFLPAGKVSEEIAAVRGVPVGMPVASPARHRAFSTIAEMVDVIEAIADATALPVGIKSAVGQTAFWSELAHFMSTTKRGPDFITVDGGEGGTGAGPLVFTDNVAYPFRHAMAKVYSAFLNEDLHQDIVFMGAGKLGYPQNALVALTLGCDVINVGREAMMAIGCIQAQRCHTSHCPTGVATQRRWLQRGLDPTSKGVRASNYIAALRHDLLRLAHAAGVPHPSLLPSSAVEIVSENSLLTPVTSHFGLPTEFDRLSTEDNEAIVRIMEKVGDACN